MKRILIEKSAYLDSVSLMRVSKLAGEAAGVRSAMVAMATDTNVLLLREAGFDPAGAAGATPNDLIIALDAEDDASFDDALALVMREIQGGTATGEEGPHLHRTIDAAVRARPDLNLVFISVPGQFAAAQAERALLAGKHVMIFSDNVPVEDEVRLKALGRANGLLVMGPDCGTAIVNGVGLGFANAVPRGNVGIVSASGTGAQEVSSVLARLGVGVSQLIGTGGRDVSADVGGVTTTMGLTALIADSGTEVIVIISKVPDEAVGGDILGLARQGGKPCIIWFAGQEPMPERGNLTFGDTLADTARRAASAATGRAFEAPSAGDVSDLIAGTAAEPLAGRKFVRGLFGGGTLGQEAVFILKPSLGNVNTNMKLPGTSLLDDPSASKAHTIVDLGDDAFTRGRAHPMIDQSYKLARIAKEFEDPETAVILMDVVLGYGCNMDPGGEIVGTLRKLKDKAAANSAPAVVVSLCGTHDDPQGYARQKRELEAAGAIVADTNELGCTIVAKLIGG
jgi:succinyl-CoA synthetase alpha subunit